MSSVVLVHKRGTSPVGKHTFAANEAAAGAIQGQWYLGTYLQPCQLPPGHMIKSQSSHSVELCSVDLVLTLHIHFVAGVFQGHLWTYYHESYWILSVLLLALYSFFKERKKLGLDLLPLYEGTTCYVWGLRTNPVKTTGDKSQSQVKYVCVCWIGRQPEPAQRDSSIHRD